MQIFRRQHTSAPVPSRSPAADAPASTRRPTGWPPHGVGRGVPAEPRRPNALLSPPSPAHQTARALSAKSRSPRQPVTFSHAGKRCDGGQARSVWSRHSCLLATPPDGVPTAWSLGGSGGFPHARAGEAWPSSSHGQRQTGMSACTLDHRCLRFRARPANAARQPARPTVASAKHPAGLPPRGVGRGVPAEPRGPNNLLPPPSPAPQTARALSAMSHSPRKP